ncbi:hypothetical protein BS78_01G280700 [Paspalum vaginatum]|nr:hypothetical protein BS78_01G280700 [Paspalum vaginatum]
MGTKKIHSDPRERSVALSPGSLPLPPLSRVPSCLPPHGLSPRRNWRESSVMTNPRQRSVSGGRKSAPPHPPLPPPPSEQGLGVPQFGADEEMSQETGTTKNIDRANWNHQMKLYLIGLLKLHDLPKFRTHNAWSKEAWTSMVGQFNSKFSLSYSIAQVKQKEQYLKKDFRAIKDLREESGFGWDSNRMMVTA